MRGRQRTAHTDAGPEIGPADAAASASSKDSWEDVLPKDWPARDLVNRHAGKLPELESLQFDDPELQRLLDAALRRDSR